MTLIAPRHLWRDGALHAGLAVETDGAMVTAVRPLGSDTPDLAPLLLAPALTDLQVNGGGGVMVNSDPTPEGLRAVAEAHRGLGTGGILPTVITDRAEVTLAAADAVLACRGEPGILGLHIEGPHISPEKKGTHSAELIRPLDRGTVELVTRLRAEGVPVMLTLAPELADPELLAELAATGAVLSAGHTAADAAQTRAGLEAGITCFTHLYNAMPPMTSRAPGVVGTSITSEAFCGLIADGIHVSWEMAQIAIRARPRPDRMFLVSDAMATVGGPDHFTLYGQEIRVQDGALINAEGSLAGAHVDMATSLANAHRHIGLPLAQAVAMCTDIPRACMGLPTQSVSEGWALTDLLALDDTLARLELPA